MTKDVIEHKKTAIENFIKKANVQENKLYNKLVYNQKNLNI